MTKRLFCICGVLTMLLAMSGCSKPTGETQPAADQAASDKTGTALTGHTHGGWWCNEHGVPEGECGLCDSKLAAEFQKQGDWCAKHDRPDSQCFECHPEHEAKFARRYEAKYGKQPPKREG